MARSQESWSKKEREKKRQQKKKEKEEKKLERKNEAREQSRGMDDMLAYVDEEGNLTATPPDPTRKTEVKAEDIVIGVPKKEDLPADAYLRKGKVSFFNEAKGFGFISEENTGERVFFHISDVSYPVQENDKVMFEIGSGKKGPVALKIQPA